MTWPPNPPVSMHGDVDEDAPSGTTAIREAQVERDHADAEALNLQPGDVVEDGEVTRTGIDEISGAWPHREYRDVPVGAITASPTNRAPKNIDDLVPSIRDQGVLQPILVRQMEGPGGAERFELIAGERRWRAAMAVGFETIPAMVATDVPDTRAFVQQLVENLQREGLDPLFEGAGYQQLLDTLDCTQRDLADRLGISQSHISKRVQLLDLPAEAQALLDSGGITIEDALELAKLKDHPKIQAEVLRTSGDGDLAWAVDRALGGIETERKKAEEIAALKDRGIKVLGEKAATSGFKRVDINYGGLEVDSKKHEKEPCHAVQWAEYGGRFAWCTDPKRHGARGDSDLKVPKKETTKRTGEPAKAKVSPAVEKKRQARAEADAQREAFMADLVQNRKIRPDDVIALALNYLVKIELDAGFIGDEQELIGTMLGIDPPKGAAFDRWGKAIEAHAAGGRSQLLRTVLAIIIAPAALGVGETEQARRLLLDAGYQPHASEKADFAKAAKQ